DRERLNRLRERADGVDALQKRARRLRVLAQPVAQPRGDTQRAERQAIAEVGRGLAGADVERVRNEKERSAHRQSVRAPASGSIPARRSSSQVRINGRTTRAVGSSLPTLSTSAIPRVSILALPAQSYGISARR